MSSSAQKRIQKKQKRNARAKDRKPSVRRKVSRTERLTNEALQRGEYIKAAITAAKDPKNHTEEFTPEAINKSIDEIIPEVVRIHALLEVVEYAEDHDHIDRLIPTETVNEIDRLSVRVLESIEQILKALNHDMEMDIIADVYVHMLNDMLELVSEQAPIVLDALEGWDIKLDKAREELIFEIQNDPKTDGVDPTLLIQQRRMAKVYQTYATPATPIEEETVE